MTDLYVGLMSGTSLDGVDAALVDFGTGLATLRGTAYVPYPSVLREACYSLNASGSNEVERCALVANELSRTYAGTVKTLLSNLGLDSASIAAIGCHGQTIRHRPDLGYTVQLVNGALLSELTGIRTVVDFRSRDVAAGGHGAPLVPAFHHMWFHRPGIARAVVNIGGIANLTVLSAAGTIGGFDTGPGNALLDLWAMKSVGEPVDREGSFAASGRVVDELLGEMLAEPYFAASPPKSTGRDLFNAAWLDQFELSAHKASDVQATLVELTARSIASCIRMAIPEASEIYVCGGGAKNIHLMQRLATLLQPASLHSTAALGLDPDWVEACAFAWFARCAILGAPANVPAVTGAAGPRILGAIYAA